MKKIKTLKMNYEFKNVFSKGKYYVGSQIITYILTNKYQYNRIGIAISSKLCNAVKRNHIKRLVRAAYQNFKIDNSKSVDIVFIWNKKADIEEASYHKIYENMKKAFLRAGIIE